LREQPDHETLDLIEMRRQLTALRSNHSDNLLITSLLNRFFVKVAFLLKPTDLAHEQYLKSEFERTLTKVKEIAARTKSDWRPHQRVALNPIGRVPLITAHGMGMSAPAVSPNLRLGPFWTFAASFNPVHNHV
jgi:hypothetical protein